MATEARYTEYADKEPTPLQEHFATWIVEQTGINVEEKYESIQEAFDDAVRLAVALRMPYQSSKENRTRTAELREAKEKADEEARAARKKVREEKDAELERKRAQKADARKKAAEEKAEKQRLADEAKAAQEAAAVEDEDVEDGEEEGDEVEDTTPAPAAKKTSARKPRGTARASESVY